MQEDEDSAFDAKPSPRQTKEANFADEEAKAVG